MTRQHVLIVGALVILLFIIGLPFMGDDDAPEPARETIQTSETDLPPSEPAPEPEPMPEPEPVMEPEPEPEPEVSEAPAPEPEQEEPEPAPEPEPLPPLNESDQFATQQLREIAPQSPLIDKLASSQLVRKTVVLVDNMSRGEVPPRDRPLEGPTEEIQVRQIGNEERWIMEEASYRRFDDVVNAFTALETEQLLALYDRASPLLEEAYAELGYPDREFDETLIQAITRVLNASTPEGPFELTLPSVHYEFADERLESLSRVEKLLIRMGPENARKVKEKLREVRQALLAREEAGSDGQEEQAAQGQDQ